MLLSKPLLLAASLFASEAVGASILRRQGNNEVYQGNEAEMTAAFNVTYWIVPVPKAQAAKMAGAPLLTPTGFGDYLSADEHPIIVSDGYQTDIRMLDLRVDALRATSVNVPFVDTLGDGKTAFRKGTINYQDQLIPALVGTVAGNNPAILPAAFEPPHKPYRAAGGGVFTDRVSVGVDNKLPVVGGPGMLHPVFQTTFGRNDRPQLPESVYKALLRQPQQKAVGKLCAQETDYFNSSQAMPFFVKANDLQTYPPTTPSDMKFTDRVEGYSLTLQWVYPAGPGKPCSTFA